MTQTLTVACPQCGAGNRLPTEKTSQNPVCGKCQTALFQAKAYEANTAQFKAHVRHSTVPVVVDFWASWCGPCQMMAPQFEQAAKTLEPKARFIKVNTETEQQLGAQLNIRSIPTVMVFEGGKKVREQAGAMNAAQLEAWLRL